MRRATLVADFGNHKVRRISPDGAIATVAGTGQRDRRAMADRRFAAQLMSPRNVVFDSVGNLYISEFEGHRVRKVARDGTITTHRGHGRAGINLDPKQASMPALRRSWLIRRAWRWTPSTTCTSPTAATT